MLQVEYLQSYSWPYLFLLLLADPWMAPGPDSPPWLRWACCCQHPGLTQVLWGYPHSHVAVLLLCDVRVSSLQKEKGSLFQTEFCMIPCSKIWCPPPPGCTGRCNELFISCWVCNVSLFPGCSQTSWGSPLGFALGISLGFSVRSAAPFLNKQWEQTSVCSASEHSKASSRTRKYRSEGLKA